MKKKLTVKQPAVPAVKRKSKKRLRQIDDLDEAGCQWLKNELRQTVARLKAEGRDIGKIMPRMLIDLERHEANLKAKSKPN